MIQKVIRAGHSIAVVIPSQISRIMGIHAGDQVRLTARPEKGKITLTFSGTLQLPLTVARKRIT